MKHIEVEGGELALKNSFGDMVIIPKKNKKEVEKMIDTKCWECVDSFVDTLPINEDYAEDGSLYSELLTNDKSPDDFVYDAGTLNEVTITEEAPQWLKYRREYVKNNPFNIDEYVEIYERDFFKNSARVDFALTTDAIMDQDKADQIKERWLSKFKGRFHDVAILDSGLKPVPLKYTNRDFEFLALAKWSKEKILSAYRVPENKLGSVESNRQGSVFSDISFNRESIKPRLVLWDEELTMGVCSSYDLRLQVRHNDPIPRDRQLEVMEAKTYLAGLPSKTIDEYRKEVHNLPPVDGGNKLIIPNKFIYLEDMDKVTGALINPPQNERDRDNETPHVNPDGTDDRDDNPTDGRSISIEPELKIINMDSFFSLYVTIGSIWNKMCFDYLITNDPIFIQENFKILFNDLSEVTIDVLSKNFEKDTIITSNDCIYSLIEKASIEYIATLFKEGWDKVDWKEYVNIEFKTNVRLSKIINTIVKAHINFVKYQILIKNKDNIEWVVNSNECGHRGKIKNFIVKDHFESNRTPIKFPGEIWNFTCDCTITRHKGE